ncbi:MAG: VOC family protein [Burkholderiaceae bacterium]|jgi:catechol 2,3-dioxygenase-like lactoylglutathione lyase family enzyme|nr:VOC family protein [Burkholderiaceae bacterium]
MTRAPFEIFGFNEAVLIVRDERPHLDCWLGQGAWELRHEGAVDPRLLQAWGRPGATGREWLLAHPDCKTGLVRLMRLNGAAPQTDIRQDDQCLDTGGIFDLNVRVLDLARQAERMRALHWHGGAPPIAWDFGALKVREWLVRGPDNVRLALIERVAPPLTGFDHIREFSQIFNSSQIVRDMAAAVAFYRDVLGFQNVVQYEVPHFPPGPNLFGIPPGVSERIGLSLNILHPQGRNEGSIELVTNPGAQGRDLSADAGPPHYGMAALRFPVRGIEAFAEHLAHQGHAPAMPLTRLDLAPLGRVQMLALRTPDGAWLEFVEPVS